MNTILQLMQVVGDRNMKVASDVAVSGAGLSEALLGSPLCECANHVGNGKA